jgi:cell shape-determining protein MreD
MNVLGSAFGAILAAIIESSVLTHLQAGGVKPDLVLALGIAVTMTLGFESGVTWALAGGLMMDMLIPERALGATALAMLAVTGLALLVARVTSPRRVPTVMGMAFLLAFVYQGVLVGLLAVTSGVGISGISIPAVAGTAVLDALLAGLAVIVLRALELRFGEIDRGEW